MRLWVLVCLAALASPAAGQGVSEILKAVENRYNRARTLQVLFEQTYTVQGGRTITESGELSLRKPGRMRWEYSSPKGKLLVSDGKSLYFYSPNTNRAEKMSMRETDDMRAPLAFLMGRLDFWRDFERFISRPEAKDLRITAEPRSDKLPYIQVEFVVTPDHQIRHLIITGQDHSVMTFNFARERLNPPLAERLFEFQPPAGAEFVDLAGQEAGGE